MSNTIPPLLNSSPPPIVGPLDDFDDEFGDFNSARDSSFDFDVLSFPYNSTQISSHIVDHVSNVKSQNKDELKKALNEEHQSSDLQSDTESINQVLNEDKQSTSELNDNIIHPSVEYEKTNGTLKENAFSAKEHINIECNGLVKTITNIEEIKYDTNTKEPDHYNEISNETSQSKIEINDNDNDKNKCISNSYQFKEDSNCDFQSRHEMLDSKSVNNSSQEDICTLNSEGIENINFNKLEPASLEISQEIIIESAPSDGTESQKVEIVTNLETENNEAEEEHGKVENNNSFEKINKGKNEFDDFSDFNDYITTNVSSSDVLPDQSKQEDDFDDFADFSCASSLSTVTDPEVEISSSFTFPKLEEIETTIKKFFPLDQQDVADFSPEYNEKDDIILKQIRDITDTKALIYKWSKSSSQSSLFKALNIDMRNILYGPRWNETMPPFAATLGFVPLEPVKSESTIPQTSSDTISPVTPIDQIAEKDTLEDVPSAQFDWNLAGLTNPLDYSNVSSTLLDFDQFSSTLSYSLISNSFKINSPIFNDNFKEWTSSPTSQSNNSLKGFKPSSEKVENIAFGDVALSKIGDDTSVKSLNFNEITTDYDSLGQINKPTARLVEDEFGDFEGFTSYQYPVDEKVKEIPLRETYISYQTSIPPKGIENSTVQVDEDADLEFSSWAEVNKQQRISNAQLDTSKDSEDDFDNFQASSPPVQKIKSVPSNQQLHTTQDNISEVPCTKNSSPTSSSLPVATLVPAQITSNYTCLTPLQPIPVGNNVQIPPKIEWPEPGISGQDFDDIELSYKPKIFSENNDNSSLIANNEKEKKPSEEDDWSDFVSSENAPGNSAAGKTSLMFGLPGKPQAELQLSISQLNQIQPPKKPTPVLTHQGLYISGSYQSVMQMTQSRPHRQTVPTSRPTNTDFEPSLISNQYAKQVETLAFGHHNMYNDVSLQQQQTFAPIAPTTPQKKEGGVNDDEEWSDFVSSRPVLPTTNEWTLRDTRPPNWPPTNVTPNIITNPVAFDSFRNYAKAGGNSAVGSVNVSPFVSSGGGATSVPELDFVVPKSRTWKK